MSITKQRSDPSAPRWRHPFRRGPWESLATAIIAVGVVMLCQPFLLVLYSYSFVTILTGVVMFMIVTKFPD